MSISLISEGFKLKNYTQEAGQNVMSARIRMDRTFRIAEPVFLLTGNELPYYKWVLVKLGRTDVGAMLSWVSLGFWYFQVFGKSEGSYGETCNFSCSVQPNLRAEAMREEKARLGMQIAFSRVRRETSPAVCCAGAVGMQIAFGRVRRETAPTNLMVGSQWLVAIIR